MYLLGYQNFGAAHQITKLGARVQSHCFTDESTGGERGPQGPLSIEQMQVAGEGKKFARTRKADGPNIHTRDQV